MDVAASTLDVVAVGSAIVDVLAHVDDALVAALGLAKGTMTLVDLERSAAIYESMPPGIEVSGGSAANTAAGVASLGGGAAFIGKVRDGGQVVRRGRHRGRNRRQSDRLGGRRRWGRGHLDDRGH